MCVQGALDLSTVHMMLGTGWPMLLAALSYWRCEEYTMFFSYLDRTGCFYYQVP